MIFLSVMIPNYNGRALLEEYLPHTIAALESLNCTSELVVADDASEDNSCSFLRTHYPTVVLVEGEKNLGFSGNCNRGIQACRGSWVLVLNSDVRLGRDYLEKLMAFTGENDVFGLGGSIFPDGPGPVMDAGKFPARSGLMLNTTLNFEPIGQERNCFPSLFLSGAASLLNAEKFRSLGGFREIFNPYYFEDAEISLHAWRRGWKSLYVPEAVCYHRISSTIGKAAQKEAVRITARRNKLLMHSIHLGGWRRTLWEIMLLFYPLTGIFRRHSIQFRAFEEFRNRKTDAYACRKAMLSVTGLLSLEKVISDIRASLQGKVKRTF